MMNEQPKPQAEVVLGVDTHLDVHVGAMIDVTGRVLATQAFEASPSGYEQLIGWAGSFRAVLRAGGEGTGTYGAGLAHTLSDRGIAVFEVNRPDRARRRRLGKINPTDAESAARAVLAGDATALPKTQSGAVEAMRVVGTARRSAVKARTQAINQLRALLVTSPDALRAKLLRSKPEACVRVCLALQPGNAPPGLPRVLTATLRLLARRWATLSTKLRELDATLQQLARYAAGRLLKRFGVGPQTAAVLLVVAGDNPERLRSEAALAALCGLSPLEASSGKTTRHRLNRGGNRLANNALWTIAMVRMRSDPRTRAYVARRTAEGMSTKESSAA